MSYSGDTRAVDGFILQALGPGDQRRWFVRQGRYPSRAERRGRVRQPGVDTLLADVCAEIDALPGEWKVETISTPSTILRDLQGSRGYQGRGRNRTVGVDARMELAVAFPEQTMLGRIGRMDLCATVPLTRHGQQMRAGRR